LIPIITWEPWKQDFENPTKAQPEFALCGAIAAGKQDDYIRSWAEGSAEAEVDMIIRFGHEMSTPGREKHWYPWQGQSECYVRAFQHIVGIFREEGADKVEFMWSPMWSQYWEGTPERYYPGDQFVDIVGTTILNHGLGTDTEWGQWFEFAEMFGPQYEYYEQLGKPIFVMELGSAEQGGDKAQWLRDAYSSLSTDYPLVQGVVMLEVAQDREWPDINWSVTSSSEALETFQELMAHPYFKGARSWTPSGEIPFE
jgi:beta-mannanase